MKAPFDIAGDFDTPVSAFAKLAPFNPRFLLESVEGGERLGRYSFIGFGEALEVRLDADGFRIGGERRAPPRDAAELLDGLRLALRMAPLPEPSLGSVPLAGGLVGYTSYDFVRFLERLPARLPPLPERAAAALRRAALAAGVRSCEPRHRTAACRQRGRAQRAAREVIAALRGPLPRIATPARLLGARAGPGARGLHRRRARRPGIHRGRRRLPARAGLALRRPPRARSVPGLPRAAADQSLALHVSSAASAR